MTWKELLEKNQAEAEPTDKAELDALRKVVDRSLADAHLKGISSDGRFGHAYDAVRALSTMAIRACGYRIKSIGGAHYNTFIALKAVDPKLGQISSYLNTCRRKRNDLMYEEANVVSNNEAEELLLRATTFKVEVESWVKKNFPQLA